MEDIRKGVDVRLVTADQAPVVQKLDSAIHRINRYPADKYSGNQLRYPLDGDLSTFWTTGAEEVVQTCEQANIC